MSKQQKIITSIVGITIVLLALLGITYAYYLTRIEGNTNTNSISITTADLKLVYGDGNGIVTKENIMPGTTIEKTFTVTNDGNNKVDNYAVYLEEVINTLTRTEDLTYKLECTSNSGTCNGSEGEFPTLAGMIVTNSIDTEVTHTYKLTVTYKNEENIDQSDDMGSTISAFVQIYALKDILDIEGEVTGASEGDYAQINSVQKRSQIVDDKYKFAGVLPGTHTIKICGKTDINCTNPKLSKQIVINLGNEAGVVDNKITITDDSQTATININLNTQVETDKVIIGTEIKDYVSNNNPFTKGTLAYNILNNALNPVSSTSTVYSATPLTTPGVEASGENERILSIIEDDYTEITGMPSYYFRGNVVDNYVNFSGMCWRIVRIQGNGTIKLALADENGNCNDESYSVDNSNSAFINNGQGYEYGLFDFDVVQKWGEDKSIDTSSLDLESKWCQDFSLGEILYDSRTDEYIPEYGEHIRTGFMQANYGFSIRNSPTLKCDMVGINNTNAIYNQNLIGGLTADEIILAGAFKSQNAYYYLVDNASDIFIGENNPEIKPTYLSITPGQLFEEWDVETMQYQGGVYIDDGLKFDFREGMFRTYYRSAVILKKSIISTNNGSGAPGSYTNPYVIN